MVVLALVNSTGMCVFTPTGSLLSWMKNCLHLKEIFTIFNLEREKKRQNIQKLVLPQIFNQSPTI